MIDLKTWGKIIAGKEFCLFHRSQMVEILQSNILPNPSIIIMTNNFLFIIKQDLNIFIFAQLDKFSYVSKTINFVIE